MEKKLIEGLFKKELDSFEAPMSGYRDFVVAVISKLPAYFTKANQDGSENGIVSHTKASVAFANTLFALEEYRKMFGVSERDAIRAALLLHDGLYYGAGDEPKATSDHPELMATLLESEAWETFLPSFLRSDIVSAIRKHSGRKTANGIAVEEPSDIDRFVHMCVYLATRKETTVQLPGTEAYYRRNLGQKTALDINTAASIVRQITDGCRWDGQVYMEGEARFVVLDGNRVQVADELRDAFLVVGQARAASMQNPGYLNAGQPAGQAPAGPQDMVLQWNEFVSRYPDWNMVVYGRPGELFIQSCGQNIPIPDAQAAALGIAIP